MKAEDLEEHNFHGRIKPSQRFKMPPSPEVARAWWSAIIKAYGLPFKLKKSS